MKENKSRSSDKLENKEGSKEGDSQEYFSNLSESTSFFSSVTYAVVNKIKPSRLSDKFRKQRNKTIP